MNEYLINGDLIIIYLNTEVTHIYLENKALLIITSRAEGFLLFMAITMSSITTLIILLFTY